MQHLINFKGVKIGPIEMRVLIILLVGYKKTMHPDPTSSGRLASMLSFIPPYRPN